MDVIVLAEEHDAGTSAFLPSAVRDALPRLFIETTQPLALVSDDGALVAVNSGFCALVGRTPVALAGTRISDLVHADERVAHLASWRVLLAGVVPADRVESRLIRADSSIAPVVMYRTVVSRPDGTYGGVGLAAVHDESATRDMQTRASRFHEVIRQLADATVDVAASAVVITRAAADLVGDGAWLWTVDTVGRFRLAESWHRDPRRGAALAAAVADPPSHAGLLRSSVALNRPLRVVGSRERSGTEDIWEMFTAYADEFGVSGLLVLPVTARGRTFGAIGVVRDGSPGGLRAPYADSEVGDMAALARTVSTSLDNAMAFAEARSDQQLVRALLDAIPVMAGVIDAEGRIIDVNAAWRRATATRGGIERNPVGNSYLDPWDAAAQSGITGAAEIAAGVRAVIAGTRAEFSGDSAYVAYAGGDGGIATPHNEMWLHVHAATLKTPASARPLIVVDHLDITDRKRLEVRLAYEATHDPLTRLPNRTLLIDRINQALARDRRAGLRTAVLFCDLDDFKQINDTFGHDVGDVVLATVATRFADTVRASDTVARIGGDEFVVLIEALSDLDEALIVADKLAKALQEPVADSPRLPGVSVGVALSYEGATAESLLRASDATMYSVKQSGRGGVSVADETTRPI